MAPGTVVLGERFRILRLLGRGGMGDVYLAEQISLGRQVAIKRLREDLCAQPAMLERFHREARLLSTVDHPAIVRVIDFGQWQGGYYLVMEYVEGETLAAALRNGPFAPERAARVLRHVAEGLEAIHTCGIVHRDLKLENVLLAAGPRGEQARLLDFGIARLVEAEGAAPALTQAGLVVGTPESISPEQAMGKPADRRSDVYSFGVLAFQLLTGRSPFTGPSVREYLAQHISTPPPPLISQAPSLDAHRELCQLIMACLEKLPASRPADGQVLVEKLTSDGERLAAEREDPGERRVPIQLLGVAPTGSAQTKRRPLRARALAMLGRIKGARRRRAAVALVGFLAATAVVVVGVVSSQIDRTAGRARDLLVEGKAAQALDMLDHSEPTPERRLVRVAALHRLGKHADEHETLGSLGVEMSEVDELVISGLAEDYADDEEHEELVDLLAKVPAGALKRLAALPYQPPSKAQWGALRFLDREKSTDVDLVTAYIGALGSVDCHVRARAAERLGGLGDRRATAPLEAVLKQPRKPGFLFLRQSCGHREAERALAALHNEQ